MADGTQFGDHRCRDLRPCWPKACPSALSRRPAPPTPCSC